MMNKRLKLTPSGILLILLFLFQPQAALAVPAFLPMSDTVPMSEPMAIDGVWNVSTINKRIRIEGGRAYAIDSWLHLFLLEIQPEMVVIQNIKQAGTGEYVADDLPLLSKWKAKLNANGNISVTVQTLPLPTSYELIRVEVDNPDFLQQEMINAGLASSAESDSEYGQDNHGDDCQQLVIDPDTNQQVCLD